MEKEIKEAQNSLEAFEESLAKVESALNPLLRAVDAIREEDSQVSPLTTASTHATLAYAVNALYLMYLRANGVDPDTHPILDEIERVQSAFKRLREARNNEGEGEGEGEEEEEEEDGVSKDLNEKCEPLKNLLADEEDVLLRAVHRKSKKRKESTHTKFEDSGAEEEKANDSAKKRKKIESTEKSEPDADAQRKTKVKAKKKKSKSSSKKSKKKNASDPNP